MNLNPPRQVRAILYLIATFGTPVAVWAGAKGWLDEPTAVLSGTLLALIMGLATANTAKTPQDERGAGDAVVVLLVAILVFVVLLFFGVRLNL